MKLKEELNDIKKMNKKIIIAGTSGGALIVYSMLRQERIDIEYFINANNILNIDYQLNCRFGKAVYPVEKLLMESLDDIVVINCFAYFDILDSVFKSYGLEENRNYFNLNGLLKVKKADKIDLLLGYNRSGDLDGFQILGDGTGTRIVVLGGSTTDPTFSNLKSWPVFLYEKCRDIGEKVTVYNGGMYGYTSCQERDKFFRDVIHMKPDIVISYSGANDIGWSMIDKDYPYYSKSVLSQNREFERITNKSISLGVQVHLRDYDNWINNQNLMHTVATAYNMKFLTFLQPNLMLMKDRIYKQIWLNNYLENIMSENSSRKNTVEAMDSFYLGVKKYMGNKKNMIDLSNIFDTHEEVYLDWVHCDEIGNEMVAESILNYL